MIEVQRPSWRPPKAHVGILAAVSVVYVLLCIGSAVTKRPDVDEGWFAGPAHGLITNGTMGTPVLEPANVYAAGRNFHGIDKHTYWILPLHPVVQAAWYTLFGFSLLSMRTLSMLWGLVALVAWYVIARELFGSKTVALLTYCLIAMDYTFVRSGAHGRMDMMCVALGFGGIAVYLSLRARHLWLAILLGHTLVAASMFTHPNGMLHAVGLLFLMVYYDRGRIAWRVHLPLVAAPYLVGGLGWGLYIMQAPGDFLLQSRGQAAGRFSALRSPFEALKAEITARYIGEGGAHYLKFLLVAVYAVGIAGALLIAEIRRLDGCRVLLVLASWFSLYFWLLEGTKLYLYVVHIAPMFLGLVALLIDWAWRRRFLPRPLIATFVAVMFFSQMAGVGYVVLRDDQHKAFLPAISFLKSNVAPGQIVMGSATLGFGLGFGDFLVDDIFLGYMSGKSPDYVVAERSYQQAWSNVHRDPVPLQHARDVVTNQMRIVYDHAGYVIYARR